MSKNLIKPGNHRYNHENDSFQHQNQSSLQLITCKSGLVDLFITEDKKRLEVVSFILNQINMIVVNTFANTDQRSLNQTTQSKQLESQKLKINKFSKADFLRDSEIILLYICQAVLVSDSSILNNESLQALKANYIKLKLPVEQISCFIDLIKTSVIDFINSITSDSTQNVHCLVSEVASYFEMVITLMIKLE